MTDFNKIITDKIKEMENSGTIQKIIENKISETINSAINNCFNWEFENQITKQIKESVGDVASKIKLNSYNSFIATAIENIVLSMNISKSKSKEAHALDLLSQVVIDAETARRKVIKLSGGEQQRVGIARALASNSDIIIADEPTGNLDETTEQEILNLMIHLAHEMNKCVIIVTHSKEVAKNRW